ncbi:hypothetical protein Dsin_005437 [Dipteronia sinensis]|uniref:AtC3H46-like PABC-like domain-containing protein n=1 Tax=Dipteronia sinensis TaxID=43782 RepID=A0AAE0AXC9_9ROSI|nr:hypothetical protein Dsin_005437 [Dipteronia sinensis]
MDQFDATSVLFDKVKSMDSENASKIMAYILIQDFKEGNLNLSFLDPKVSPFLSYDNIHSGSCLVPGISHLNNGGGGDIGSNSRNNFGVGGGDFVDEFQFNEYLSFLNETFKNDEFKV